jgi:4-O-beta-D-mannosyl-D-glucose phosphorylase
VKRPADTDWKERYARLRREHEQLTGRRNTPVEADNGIVRRWQLPVLTRDHVPLDWRYDLDPETNPRLLERIAVNSTFNAGALLWRDNYVLVARVEGADRKSFFAIAESASGVDGFRFHARPLRLPETDDPDTNVYDMRLTQHEDGYVYGLFCSERKDPTRPADATAAVARCGIIRSRELSGWERLPDLVAPSAQQRNVVLHPEFVDGCYALYTRPQGDFIGAESAPGICFGLTESMQDARVGEERVVDPNLYHTISEFKNGPGPPPIRTREGWLHLAHGVRQTAAGLRYVLYLFMTALDRPWTVIHKPAGYLLAPLGGERVGDVSNVLFCNGWICDTRGDLFIYYASSDTRMHVATTTRDRLVDYCLHTPEDGLRSAASVEAINRLIDANAKIDPGR